MAQSSPPEEGVDRSVSKAGTQALASDVGGAHIPVVTMNFVPIEASQKAQARLLSRATIARMNDQVDRRLVIEWTTEWADRAARRQCSSFCQ